MGKKWKLIKSMLVFKSKWLSVFNNTYKLPNGQVGKDYFHLLRPDYVLIVARDKEGCFLIEKNYRRGVDNFVYELPAGSIESGETPLNAAKRELKEETGYFGKVIILGEIYPQPAFTSMKAYIAFAKIEEDKQATQELKSEEHTNFDFFKIEKVKKMIKEGRIKDMGFLSALKLVEEKGLL